jgi:hypothetical protein
LLAWAGSIDAVLGEPVVLLVPGTFGKMEEGKIATVWHSLVRLKEVNQCIRGYATLEYFVTVGSPGSIAALGEPVPLLVQLNVGSGEGRT